MGWLSAWLVLCAIEVTRGFVLDGSPTSYARFRKWNAGLNGSLEFEFKTDQANGLLLYTDDGGMYDFFEIKLVEGALRLRYNLGGGAQIVTIGRDLNDGHWHKVQVRRRNERTTLRVDGEEQTRVSRGREFQFGRLQSNSDVYIGGIPAWYYTKLTLLALPSVIFEPRFRVAVRNVVYADQSSPVPRRQEFNQEVYHLCSGFHCSGPLHRNKKTTSFHANVSDVCEERDPCQHGGLCISTDTGPICQCRGLDYEGPFCEKDKMPVEAMFAGVDYLQYNFEKPGFKPHISNEDSLTFYFKTKKPNGLLLHSNDKLQVLTISLLSGYVSVSMQLGNGKLDLKIKPHKIRFNDNQWHKFSLSRRVLEISAVTSFCHVSAVIDDAYSEHSSTAGAFTSLIISHVFIGGSDESSKLPISRYSGCLRKMEYHTDSTSLNLLELAKASSKSVSVVGKVEFSCINHDMGDPVSFKTSESHLVLPRWQISKKNSIKFKLRTIEPNGIIFFCESDSNAKVKGFISLELLEGKIRMYINFDSKTAITEAKSPRLDDGEWHEISVQQHGKNGSLTVDTFNTELVIPGTVGFLNLEGDLFLGGVGHKKHNLPSVIWSIALNHGFVGCIGSLLINGVVQNLAELTHQQDSQSVVPACTLEKLQCVTLPCMNGGVCTEGWNRFICDCSRTAFTGPTCGKHATTMSFNGTQYLLIALPVEQHSQVEDLILRFKTDSAEGLLLTFHTSSNHDRITIALHDGVVSVTIHIADKQDMISSGMDLNNNQWHTIKFSRRGAFLNLQVDNLPPATVESVLGAEIELHYEVIHVGGLYQPKAFQFEASTPGFVGQMQQLTFNGVQYFEMAKTFSVLNDTASTIQIEMTSSMEKPMEPHLHHVVTFHSKHTYVGLPVLHAYSSLNIFFQFRTHEPNGLILYNSGFGEDLIALELIDGHLYCTLNFGDGPLQIKDSSGTKLSDDQWHSVTIDRSTLQYHALVVDDHVSMVTNTGKNQFLDLSGILYLGGVPKEMSQNLPKYIVSQHGFKGCFGSLDMNGESPDILQDALVPSLQVAKGCDSDSIPGDKTKCRPDVCSNKGVCVQQWNTFTCDCDLTSFTGPNCLNESVSFEWGPERGLITFVYPKDRQPEMQSDVLALGFSTTKDDAVLFRVDSATSHDYIELKITDGLIITLYNMGTADHSVTDPNIKVNDNFLHVARISRSGPNVTLQIDDYNPHSVYPSGYQLSVFNKQAFIQIGGKWNRSMQRIEKPYQGIITGLVFNGQRLLDLSAKRDPRIEIRGDVTQVFGIREKVIDPYLHMQQTPPSGTPEIMDDLVFSGAGSGCSTDDEDQCTSILESGSGDDLITPVYVAPTRPPVTTKGDTSSKESGKPCDDEDCFAGSGAGEITGTETTLSNDSFSSTHIFGPSTYDHSTSQKVSETAPTSPSTETSFFQTDLTGGYGSSFGVSHSHTPTSLTTERTESPSTPSTTEVTSPPTTPTTTMTPWYPPTPFIPPRPPPPPPPPPPTRITSETAESTAFVILVVAGTLIIIILIILLILKLNQRSDIVYKVDDGKGYQSCHGQNTALLPAGNHQSPSMPHGLNGYKNTKTKKREVKDVKEWYV